MNVFLLHVGTTYYDGSEFVSYNECPLALSLNSLAKLKVFFFLNAVLNVTTDIPPFQSTRPCCRVPGLRAVLVRLTHVFLCL